MKLPNSLNCIIALCAISINSWASSSIGAAIGSNNVYSSATSKVAYVFNNETSRANSLYKCTINGDSSNIANYMTFKNSSGNSTCTAVDSAAAGQDTSSNPSWLYAHGATVSGNYLYVLSITSGGSSWIQSCKIDPSTGNILDTCKYTGYAAKTYMANSILAVTLSSGSYLYVGNGNRQIASLPINSPDGTLNVTNKNDNIITPNKTYNGQYIHQMSYSAESNTLYYLYGPDSDANYYLAYCTLDSSTGKGATCNDTYFTFNSFTTYSWGLWVKNNHPIITNGLAMFSNKLYVSANNKAQSSTGEGVIGTLALASEKATESDVYSNSSTSMPTNMITTLDVNGDTYLYIGYTNTDMRVCNLTQSPKSNKNCVATGSGISGGLGGIAIYTIN